VASLINLGVALVLLQAARQTDSITLEANARHLLTDVWTSAGVVAGVGLVAVTGWIRLDPIVALIVAVNIVWSSFHILRDSIRGLMDAALPSDEQAAIQQVLEPYKRKGIQFHALRTRQSGARRFVSVHVLAPGDWSIQKGHELVESIESQIRANLANITVFTHLEPLEDPVSWEDASLDRFDSTDST
jgi:cation diffusion facilitator family transporter